MTSGQSLARQRAARCDGSVDDVERVAQGFVEACACDLVEVADGSVIQVVAGDRDDVVAVDHAPLGQAMLDTEFHFGADSTDGACDRCTGDRCEHVDCGVTGEHADRTPPGRGPEVRPVDVVASYHAGELPRRRGSSGESTSGLDECRIDRLALVRGAKLTICGGERFGLQHRVGATAHQFGSVRAEVDRQLIEPFHEIVIELNEYFAPGHGHMLSHMAGPRTGRNRCLAPIATGCDGSGVGGEDLESVAVEDGRAVG